MYFQNFICICISSFCWISPSIVRAQIFNAFLMIIGDVVFDQSGLVSEYAGFLVHLISVPGDNRFNILSRLNKYLYRSNLPVFYL